MYQAQLPSSEAQGHSWSTAFLLYLTSVSFWGFLSAICHVTHVQLLFVSVSHSPGPVTDPATRSPIDEYMRRGGCEPEVPTVAAQGYVGGVQGTRAEFQLSVLIQQSWAFLGQASARAKEELK